MVSLIYGRTIAGNFVFDDRGIVEHKALLQFNNIPQVLASPYWTKTAGLYRPATLLSYVLNYSFFGPSPWGFHLINLVLYAWSAYLIFLLLNKIFRQRALAYLSAVIFLLLPIHSEAVANITGRSELLALFFSLLVFLELTKENPSSWLAGFWFLLAIGSKETAIAVLPLALMVAYFKEKGPIDRNFLRKYFYPAIGLLAGGSIYFLARYFVLGSKYFLSVATSIVENPLKFVSWTERIVSAFGVLAMYLKKSFWPLGLCSDYSYNQIAAKADFFNFSTIIGIGIFSLFAVAVLFFWKRKPFLSLGSGWFLFGFLPISNLIFPIGTIAGERLMYFPSVGLCIIFAVGLLFIGERLKHKRILQKSFWFLFACAAIFYGIISFQRAGDWLTEKRLFVSAAECAPNSVLSRSNLGAAYYLEGNLTEAKMELLVAESIYNGYPKGINNLGLIYRKEGQKEKAREHFLRALNFEFPYYGAYENLGILSLDDGKNDEARKWLSEFFSGDEKAVESYIQIYLRGRGKQ